MLDDNDGVDIATEDAEYFPDSVDENSFLKKWKREVGDGSSLTTEVKKSTSSKRSTWVLLFLTPTANATMVITVTTLEMMMATKTRNVN